MTELTKPIKRVTAEERREAGATRKLIVSIEPAGRTGAVVGTRLQGTRQTFRIGVQSIYNMAVQLHLQKVEKLAKRLQKEERLPLRSARARARKELSKELK